MTKKKQTDIFRISVRRVYSRSAQMPTVSCHIATLESLHDRDVHFKRDTRALALQAALKYADVRGIEVTNRSLIEARLRQEVP